MGFKPARRTAGKLIKGCCISVFKGFETAALYASAVIKLSDFMRTKTIIVFVFIPCVLFANAGTPLLWAQYAHLFLGNFIIGIGETFYLITSQKTKSFSKVLILLVIANYLSMGIGFLISNFFVYLIGSDLMNLKNLDYIFQNILFYTGFTLGSILIEFPFFRYALYESDYSKAFRIAKSINIKSAWGTCRFKRVWTLAK